MIELGGGGEAASRGSSQCTQETDEHIRCGCGSALRTRRNGLAALISEGNAYALLTLPSDDNATPPPGGYHIPGGFDIHATLGHSAVDQQLLEDCLRMY